MTRLIIHSGMPKTGTSSLQAAFTASRERLAEAGVIYPEAALNPTRRAHNPAADNLNVLRSELGGDGATLEELTTAIVQASDAQASMIIVSAEAFTNVLAQAASFSRLERWLQRLAGLGLETELVMIWRALPHFMESMLLQSLKTMNMARMHTTLAGYANERSTYFHTLLTQLQRLESRGPCTVRLLDQGSDRFDAIAVMQEAYALPPLERIREENPRLSVKRLVLQGAIGTLLEALRPDDHRRLKREFGRLVEPVGFTGPGSDKARILDEAALSAIRRVRDALPDNAVRNALSRALSEGEDLAFNIALHPLTVAEDEALEARFERPRFEPLRPIWDEMREALPGAMADYVRFIAKNAGRRR
ncbi:MAG: hypothetical protein AAFX09_06670 [Pseudomonadota bacterium]